MADFIAVIRRAVDGLSNNTPEMRAKVYEKARAAVVRQLENMSPRPPEHMLQRQLEKLDAAIREVEAEHAEALPDGEDDAGTFPQTPVDAAHATPEAERPAVEASEEAEAAGSTYPASPSEPEVASAPQPVEPVHYSDEGDWAAEHMAEPAPVSDEPAVPAWQQPAEPVEPEPQNFTPSSEPDVIATGDQSEQQDDWRNESPSVEADLPYPASAAEATDVFVEAGLVSEEPRDQTPVEETSEWHSPDESNLSPMWGDREDSYSQEPVMAPEAVEDDPSMQPAADAEPRVEQERSLAAASSMPVVSDIDDWLSSHMPPAPGGKDASTAAAPWELPLDREAAPEPVPHFDEPTVTPTNESFASVDPVTAYDVHVAAPPATETGQFEPWDVPVPTDAKGEQPKSNLPDDFAQWFQEPVDLQAKPSDISTRGEGKPEEWLDPTAEFLAGSGSVQQAADTDPMANVLQPNPQPSYRLEPRRSRNYTPIIFAAVGILVIAGGGFAGWTYRDQVANLFGGGASAPALTTADEQPATTEQPATAEPAAAAAPEADTGPQKFTQRLRADGSEIDAGAAPAPQGNVENRSVAGQTVASATDPTDPAATSPALAEPSATVPTTPGAAPIAGDKVFLYEERIGQSSPTAIPGGVVWTALREVGADGKPDPQIQGRINIPERGISALLTIKRNTDSSLPASHIIEVVFSVPPGFEGGSIDNLQRIAMKATEQDRGDPLVAVAAKVTDDTYLIALNDFEDVVQRNLELMQSRGWIDIPVTYRNGRRALLTLDKGTDGARIFNEVIQEWNAL